MSKHLHIVCLDVPWPADYGGAIDMLNRIKGLHEAGIHIHLHYFCYNERGNPNELNQFCSSIHVYKRDSIQKSFSLQTPFIVSSRINPELVNRLQEDHYPILLEGLHCTGIVKDLDLTTRKVLVRIHNEESIYYKELATAESSFLKKLYFYNESRLIKKYSRHLSNDCKYACISEKDVDYLSNCYHLSDVSFLPAFPTWQEVKGEEGRGDFCLYHGNLSVPENEKAVRWLICKVFTKARVPFIVAGKKPSRNLQKIAELCQHTCLIADPSASEMEDLVRKAHINVLPCFNKKVTGVRLKLLHALYEGRHCVVNEPMVAGTGLEGACHVASSANAFASIISQLYYNPFAEEELRLRKSLLADTYNNKKNTEKLIQWLW